jgi:hypothetical protein
MEYVQWIMSFSFVKGALTGVITAAAVDLGAFRSWKSFDDATTYDWKTAAFRWVQGAVLGALAGAGLGQIA